MYSRIYLFILLASFIPTFESKGFSDDEYDYDVDDPAPVSRWKADPKKSVRPDVCSPVPLGGTDWLLSVRRSDYGWGEDTHRAVVALSISGWKGVSREDRKQIEMQLEVELTKGLMRNGSSSLHPNDLALYIHALVAIKRNPHNFHGLDLVARLEEIVKATRDPHPFLLLALCNARGTLTEHHLRRAVSALQRARLTNNIEYLALALNAYECAGTLNHPMDNQLIREVRNRLVQQQESDGSFGNVYKTSLVVVAMASKNWSGKRSAVEYLEKHLTKDVNMVSTYLLQIALNAEKLHFIKDLNPEATLGPAAVRDNTDDPFIQYTLRSEPDVYFTITIRVAPNMTFFDVMKLSAQHDSKFNFSYFYDRDDNPNVYSISGVPNDAEENLYWRLCLQTDMNHDRHKYNMKTIRESPATFKPNSDEHVIYWYKNTDCDVTG